MDRAAELALLDRCLELVRAGATQTGDAEHEVPTERYLDRALHERELRGIFRELPSIVAHASELPDAGSFVTARVAGVPLLVVRGAEGGPRAFVNSCRHRGTLVVAESSGRRDLFACPYHGWCYGTDGALRAVPHERGFPGLRRATHGLIELPLRERAGLVWVRPSPDPGHDLDASIEPIVSDLDALGLEEMRVFRSTAREWAANWKLLVEGGLESYHFRVTHAKTIAPYFLDNVSFHDVLGPHFRTVLPRTSVRELREEDRDRWRLRDHAHIVYQVFPSTALLVQSDHVAWFSMLPLAVDRTRVEFRMLVPRDDPREAHWERNHEITRRTLWEDFEMAEAIQTGIGEGANPSLRFGLFESALARFHREVERLSAPTS